MIKIKSDLFYVKNKDTYPPFKNGFYLEEYFLDSMIRNNRSHNDSGRKYIPALWTNFQIESWFPEKKAEMQMHLNDFIRANPCDRGYFTVVQHDDGPLLDLPKNTTVYGSCSGSIPLPLIYEDTTNSLEFILKNTHHEKKILCSFVGTNTHPIRKQIEQYCLTQSISDSNRISNNKFVYFDSEWSDYVPLYKQYLFLNTTLQSKFAFAPRGYGRSSFRFFEIFKLGTIPIYVWDDIEWLPYKDKIDYSTFCISIHINELSKLESILLGIDDAKYNKMLGEYKRFASYFQLDYLYKYVIEDKCISENKSFIQICDSNHYNHYNSISKSDTDIKISLCIPTMDRFDIFLSAYIGYYIDYLKRGIIDEIVICDENDNDFYKIYLHYGSFIHSNPDKIKIYKNEKVLGVFLNKIKVCSLANHKYIALIDSDNFADERYFNKAKEYIRKYQLSKHFILTPSFAKPFFDFSPLIRNGNVRPYLNELMRYNLLFKICFNNGNYILSNTIFNNKIQYDDSIIPKISSCDVIYFNLLCFQQIPDFELHIVPGMEYGHAVHSDSQQEQKHHIGDYYLNNVIMPAFYQFANQFKDNRHTSTFVKVHPSIIDTNSLQKLKSPLHTLPSTTYTEIDEKLNLPFYSVGNKLIDYFFKMGMAFIQGNDFLYELPDYIKNKDNMFLIKEFPSKVLMDDGIRKNFQSINLQRVFGENYSFCRDYANLWEITNSERLLFWLRMKPIANHLIQTFLPAYYVQHKLDAYPIIHFRCSDVPFIRHRNYHFQKYRYFTDSLKELASKKIDVSKVYLMYSLNHDCEDKNRNASDIYVKSLKNHLEQNNYIVELISNDPVSDFAALFYAPAVISTCSSFSFIGGFFGNGIFITEGHYKEEDYNVDGPSECPCYASFIKRGYSVNHKLIPDYYDTDSVIRILKS